MQQQRQPAHAARRLASVAAALALSTPLSAPADPRAQLLPPRPACTPHQSALAVPAAASSATGVQRFDLTGKVALITAGAGDLFGSSVTEALAEAGATVLTASRSLDRNVAFCDELRQRGFSAQGYAVDISDVASIRALHAAVMADHGRLDILVNNALTRDGHVGTHTIPHHT